MENVIDTAVDLIEDRAKTILGLGGSKQAILDDAKVKTAGKALLEAAVDAALNNLSSKGN